MQTDSNRREVDANRCNIGASQCKSMQIGARSAQIDTKRYRSIQTDTNRHKSMQTDARSEHAKPFKFGAPRCKSMQSDATSTQIDMSIHTLRCFHIDVWRSDYNNTSNNETACVCTLRFSLASGRLRRYLARPQCIKLEYAVISTLVFIDTL